MMLSLAGVRDASVYCPSKVQTLCAPSQQHHHLDAHSHWMASTTFAAPRKRQKLTTTACEPCRSRKIRCDGNKPTCEACSKRAQQCIYQATPDISSANVYVESLVSRVAQLEQDLNNARATILKLSTSPIIPTEPPQQQHHHQPFSNIDPRLLPEDERAAAGHGSVDAMGGDAGVITSDDGQTFYGSSSALDFTRQMYGSILQESRTPEMAASEVVPVDGPPSATVTYMPPESFSLLPRELSDHLLSLYWSRVHILYPFLHRESFNQAYEDLWKPSSAHHRRTKPGLGLGASKESGPCSIIFHCAFNAALALGMQFSDLPLNERERLSSTCLAKSKDLLRLDLFDDGNIALVQTLLLLTQYFQSTSWPSKCWTSIGLACRLAQGLGLHVEEDRLNQTFDRAEREMRGRVWYGCVTMDIIVSMTLGRPAMLVATSVRRLPSPLESRDEALVANGEDELFSINFLTQTVKLYRIVGRVLLNIYKTNDECQEGSVSAEDDKKEELVRGFEDELAQLIDSLPPHLKWKSPPEPSQDVDFGDAAARQSHVLHVRVLHARILLLRPMFLQFCRLTMSRSDTERPLIDQGSADTESFGLHRALSCVRTALELIESVKVYTTTGATGAWWYNVFYIRMAAMVVLLSAICPPICDALGDEQWQEGWASCVEILTKKLPQYKPVKACVAALDTLRRSVLQRRPDSVPAEQSVEQPKQIDAANGQNDNSNGAGSVSDSTHDYGQFFFDSTFDPFTFADSDLFTDFSFDFKD